MTTKTKFATTFWIYYIVLIGFAAWMQGFKISVADAIMTGASILFFIFQWHGEDISHGITKYKKENKRPN